MEKLNLLIDAKNFCFRAGVVEDLTNRRGEPVYLLYVGMKMLRKLVHDLKPGRIIFLWDGGRSKWRQKLYPEYKQRSNTGGLERYDEIISQIDIFREVVLPMFPVMQWRNVGREADDLIYAAADILALRKECSIIVSTDKDFYQLLNIADIYSPTKEDLYTDADFEEEYGFGCDQWVTYRAMTGDGSDNIKGVQGIGEVTARKIMLEYGGSLEKFCNAFPKSKIAQRALEQQDVLCRNIQLMDFRKYPNCYKLMSVFSQRLDNFYPKLDISSVMDYLLVNEFLSILKDFPQWIKPFEKIR